MSSLYTVVTTRIPHICSACNGIICTRTRAFVETITDGTHPMTRYFHADARGSRHLRFMSLNDIRREICYKREVVWFQ